MFAYILYIVPLLVKYKNAMALNKFPTEFRIIYPVAYSPS